jgi:hypothetical protein
MASRKRISAACWLLPYVLIGMVPVSAQEAHCHPSVPTNSATPSGYQERGNRCEGKYQARDVSPADVLVTAFDGIGQPIAIPSHGNITLRWPAPIPVDAWLTGQSLRRDLPYRVDHRVKKGEREFKWPTATARAAGISEISVVMTSQRTLGGRPRQAYWPVTTTVDARGAAVTRRLRLRLGADFQTLKWRFSAFDGKMVAIEQSSPWTAFSGALGRGFSLSVDLGLRAGRCYLFEVSGIGGNGLPSSRAIYLCEPAR